MKIFIVSKLLLCFFLFSGSAFSQVADDFSDGNFTHNPSWTGDTSYWKIVNNQLNSNGPAIANTISYLSTKSALIKNAEWSFFINPKLSTSGSNYADIYLVSDSANLKSKNQGYFVRVGGTLDEISLYLKEDGVATKIIDGKDKTITSSTNNPVQVKVVRTNEYKWSLFADFGAVGNYLLQGEIVDSTIQKAMYCGILVKHSASNSKKFFFDNFKVSPIFSDTLPPEITELKILSHRELQIVFSEPIDTSRKVKVRLNEVHHPVSVIFPDRSSVRLLFDQELTLNNLIELSGVVDLNGNSAVLSKAFTYYKAKFNDIIFTEIMADPSPQVGLPDYEYLEVYNRSLYPIEMKAWTLSIGSTTKYIPDLIIKPSDYYVFSSMAGAEEISKFSKNAIGFPSFPAITNTGNSIVLKNETGRVISSVSYSDHWYANELKSGGGWSLELIDKNNLCSGQSNWKASIFEAGGTPGKENSVSGINPDKSIPELVRIEVESDSLLHLVFSESIDSINGSTLSNYQIDHEVGLPGKAQFTSNSFTDLRLSLSTVIKPNQIYTLNIRGISDCSGNNSGTIESRFALPADVSKSDLIINEVLTEPLSGGADFVEIFNRSNKIIDLGTLKIATLNIADGSVKSFANISESRLLFPDEYCLLSGYPEKVGQQYFASNRKAFLKVNNFPSLNSDEEHIAITDKSGKIIDDFHYKSEMQFALLSNTKGVSLERISFDDSKALINNWHSASEIAGFATPGYKNSQFNFSEENGKQLSLVKELFSPDNDGQDDVLAIESNFEKQGYAGSINIFDSQGRLVRRLFQNELLGVKNTIYWDGLNDKREKVTKGIYIIYAEVFDLEGNVKSYKLHCVVGGNS